MLMGWPAYEVVTWCGAGDCIVAAQQMVEAKHYFSYIEPGTIALCCLYIGLACFVWGLALLLALEWCPIAPKMLGHDVVVHTFYTASLSFVENVLSRLWVAVFSVSQGAFLKRIVEKAAASAKWRSRGKVWRAALEIGHPHSLLSTCSFSLEDLDILCSWGYVAPDV